MQNQYAAIMHNAGKHAKILAKRHKSMPAVQIIDWYDAINALPLDSREILLAYEDKQDMKLLQLGTNKPTKHISSNSILLLTQAIIESAISENDEDFFKTEYGAFVVDGYDLALTDRKHYDYNITAELLLEKMRKGKIRVSYERVEEDEEC